MHNMLHLERQTQAFITTAGLAPCEIRLISGMTNARYDSSVGHAQQAQPNNGRLEVDLEGVSLQMDTFKPHGSPYAWRLAFSIHQLEVGSITHIECPATF